MERNWADLSSYVRKGDVQGKVVALQLPEGLKHKMSLFVDQLKEMGAREVIAFVDPNYGACDVRDAEAKRLGADILVHVGHNRFGNVKKTDLPVIYAPLELPADVDAIEKSIREIEGKVALCATVHYLWVIRELKGRLADKVVVGRGSLATEEGQVLGCDPGACNVDSDAAAIITDGQFHTILAALGAKKPVYIIRPDGSVERIDTKMDSILRQREAAKAIAASARSVAIAISTKRGQMNVEVAKKLAELIRKRGLRADIIASDFLFPEYVEYLPHDILVFTGCPRVPIDDYTRFKKPILTVAEAVEVWGR